MGLLIAGCAPAEKLAAGPQEVTEEVREAEEIEEATEVEAETEEAEVTEKAEEIAEEPAGPQGVTFVTSDGLTIHGRLFGKGETGIILAHAYPSDQSSWYDFAALLADKGYQVLTFDFRGYGNSEGEKEVAAIDRDLEAAWDFMEKQGAGKIFLLGASMGGTASLKVAAQRPVAGVVALSAPLKFRELSAADEVARITAPKLFLASEGDSSAVASAQQYFALAQEPKEIKIFPGSAHGTDMLKGAQGLEVQKTILEFVAR